MGAIESVFAPYFGTISYLQAHTKVMPGFLTSAGTAKFYTRPQPQDKPPEHNYSLAPYSTDAEVVNIHWFQENNKKHAHYEHVTSNSELDQK